MSTNHRAYLGGLLAALLLIGTSTATAQDTRSLKIDDGQVYIDGRLIPNHELPPGLEAEDVQVQYVFTGGAEPVIRLGDGFFVLEEGRLREADPDERSDVSVIFRGDRSGGVHVTPFDVHLAGDEFADISAYAGPHAVVMQRKAEELQQQAARLQALQTDASVRFEGERLEELERAAAEITAQAEEAARMAEAMPRLQVQGYLTQVQQKDQALFDRLVDEREMERETLTLAHEIRAMKDGPRRKEMTEELRSKLDEIFDLKQNNRRQEMEQLQQRLEDLQEKLQERERMREEIVERRLHQLLHLSDDMNW